MKHECERCKDRGFLIIAKDIPTPEYMADGVEFGTGSEYIKCPECNGEDGV